MKVMSTRLSSNSVFERETRENLAGQQQQVRNKHGSGEEEEGGKELAARRQCGSCLRRSSAQGSDGKHEPLLELHVGVGCCNIWKSSRSVSAPASQYSVTELECDVTLV